MSLKLADVPLGFMLSYQQRQKSLSAYNIEATDRPLFTLPPVIQAFSTMLTRSQQNFLDGLQLSTTQANLYEKETCNQADDATWHELQAPRLTGRKFKDVCSWKKDFESLATWFLKKTIQTAAMKYGIENEESKATSYAKITCLNVYPCSIIINP